MRRPSPNRPLDLKPGEIAPFPVAALYGAVAVIGLAALLVFGAKFGFLPKERFVEAPAALTRNFRFVDQPDGVVGIVDVDLGRQVGTLAHAQDQFVRGVLRGLARGRLVDSISSMPPFKLVARVDGTMAISDPSTGQAIELEAFGHTNMEAFDRLLHLGLPASPNAVNAVGEPAASGNNGGASK